jgi:hypothetical protein
LVLASESASADRGLVGLYPKALRFQTLTFRFRVEAYVFFKKTKVLFNLKEAQRKAFELNVLIGCIFENRPIFTTQLTVSRQKIIEVNYC